MSNHDESPYFDRDEFVSAAAPIFQTVQQVQDVVSEMRGDVKAKFPALDHRAWASIAGTACWRGLVQEVPPSFKWAEDEGLCRVNLSLGVPIIVIKDPKGKKRPAALKFNMVGDDAAPNTARTLLAKYAAEQGQGELFPFDLPGSEELANVGTWIIAGRRRDREGNKPARLSFAFILEERVRWRLNHDQILDVIVEWNERKAAGKTSRRRFRLGKTDEGVGSE